MLIQGPGDHDIERERKGNETGGDKTILYVLPDSLGPPGQYTPIDKYIASDEPTKPLAIKRRRRVARQRTLFLQLHKGPYFILN
jgi:hypothetical protein